MTDILTIGQRIAFFRKKAGFTQQQIAEKLGVSRSLVGQIEKDLTNPNLEFLSSFVKLVKIDYSSILDVRQMVDHMDELTKDNSSERHSQVDPSKPIIIPGIESFFGGLQSALKKLYKIYFIAFEPVYKKIPSTVNPEELRKRLVDGFKSEEIVQEHIREGLLEDPMIEYLTDLFLESKSK